LTHDRIALTERSFLFVPADRPDRFGKALASGAHAVILDLEDAVAPERKAAARDALADWLHAATAGVYVRVNPAGTPWHEDDCALLGLPAVRGVMLPKSEEPAQLAAVASRLGGAQVLIPLVETVAGWFNVLALARAPRVARLAFGSVDFMSDSGIQGDGAELDAVRTQLVLASRLAGLAPPVDGVSLAIDAPAQLAADVQRSRRGGFGGKLCIHPRQVPAVNGGFLPTPAELDWARRVVRALESGAPGAVAVDGKLVDKPVVRVAQALLDSAPAPSPL
jgi:citrate lyase subunit beta/citryl-CoA lyase